MGWAPGFVAIAMLQFLPSQLRKHFAANMMMIMPRRRRMSNYEIPRTELKI
jgi:hypothetical protein